MGQFSFEVGKTYRIRHSRKGQFVFRVTGMNDEWVSGEIVSGVAKAMLDYNVREAGEDITVRRSFIQSSVELEETHEATR